MRTAKHVLEFTAAAIIVMMLGGLAGWYFFIKGETAQIQTADTARGFGTDAPFSSGSNSGVVTQGTTGQPSGGTGDGTSSPGLFSRIANTLTFGWWGNSSFDAGTGITDFLPFGNSGPTDDDGDGKPDDVTTPPPPRLWRVSAAPAAGIGFIDGTANLRFVERANGNVWSADPATGAVGRITNTLMPKTYDALFSRDGSVILRSISDSGLISTFAAVASSTSATTTYMKLEGVYLPSNIGTIAVSPSTRKLLYLTTNAQGTTATEANWRDGERKVLFTSALSQWNIQWLTEKIFAVQKAADGASGYAFEVKSSALIPKLRNLPGLTYLPRAGSTAILFGTSENGNVRLYSEAAEDATPVELPIHTTAEKCVWAPGAGLIAYCAVPQEINTRLYLLDSYRGAGHTSDAWWKVDVSAGTAEQFETPQTDGGIDVFRPLMSEVGTHIAYLNARDMTIWVLRIAE